MIRGGQGSVMWVEGGDTGGHASVMLWVEGGDTGRTGFCDVVGGRR